MKFTPAQVKNIMRKGLRLLIDPEPEKEEKQKIKNYFQDHCAYCGEPIPEGQGDIDHLVSAALGGANSLANRVLSCKQCNAEEKRDRNWIEFLKAKSPSEEIFDTRRKKIEQWIHNNAGVPVVDVEILKIIEEEAERTTMEYDKACAKIRKTIRSKNLK